MNEKAPARTQCGSHQINNKVIAMGYFGHCITKV